MFVYELSWSNGEFGFLALDLSGLGHNHPLPAPFRVPESIKVDVSAALSRDPNLTTQQLLTGALPRADDQRKEKEKQR